MGTDIALTVLDELCEEYGAFWRVGTMPPVMRWKYKKHYCTISSGNFAYDSPNLELTVYAQSLEDAIYQAIAKTKPADPRLPEKEDEAMDEPPIMGLPGYGITARLYQRGGRHRDHVRKHVRRLYSEGIQIAFHYYEDETDHVAALRRLTKFMHEED